MVHYSTVVCSHNCPDACGVRVGVEAGRIVSIQGDPRHPITRGFLCGKVNRYAERVYSPQRVLYPQRRVGAKGEGRFARISWDEALDEIAQRLKAIAAEWGPEAILPEPGSGSVGQIARVAGNRLFNRLGASRLARTICSTQAKEALRLTTGEDFATDLEQAAQSKLILLWGLNAVATHIHFMPLVKRARANGARLVVIDIYNNQTARQADWFIRIRPGTDTALALGMMRVLIEENLCDRAFVERYTVGFEELRKACLEYTPETVAGLTGVPAADVLRLAREYGRTPNAFIRLGLGLSRREHGGMTIRTIACLPCLTGAWQHPGGGLMRQGWGNTKLNAGFLTRPRPGDPPARTVNVVQLGQALTALDDPPVKCLFVYGSNPAAVVPDQSQVQRGLLREDLFVVVHEVMHSDTADFADILLPATTFMEQDELNTSSSHWYVQVSRKAIAPLGESKSNLELFDLLAQKMGYTEPMFSASFEEHVAHLLDTDWAPAGGWDRAALMAGLPQKLAPPPAPWSTGSTGLKTPSGRFELYSEELRRQGLPPVPAHQPAAEGYATDGHDASGRRYPLQLCCPPSQHFLNSTFPETASSRKLEKMPFLKMHPADARARGLAQGAAVRAYNDRGESFLTLEVTDDVQPGSTIAESVWWPKLLRGRKGINQLTSQRLTDLGGSATFHDTLIEVEPAQAE